MKTLFAMIWTDQAMAIRLLRSGAFFMALVLKDGLPTTANGWAATIGVASLGMLTGDASKSGIPTGGK